MNTYHNSYLAHHGIKGQKWGVRRYQNSDGSLTNAGRHRYSEDGSEESRRPSSDTMKKVAKGAAIVGLAALSAYALKDEKTRQFLIENSSKVLNSMGEAAKRQGPKVGEFIKKQGVKAAKGLEESVSRTGKAMTDAAMLSIGTIGISKLSKKLETTDSDSESVRDRNKVLLDTATAGINSLTKANSGNSNNKKNNSGNSVGKEISEKLGEPSKKGIDKSSSEYQNLFKDSSGNQRDADTRATIKSLASAGYDLDQIQKYVDSLQHSMENIFVNEIYLGETMDNELMHYGVPGMRWGHHKPQVEAARSAYKSAKKEFKSVRRDATKSYAIGINAIQKQERALSKYNKAERNMIDAKAAYKSSKARNKKAAAKAEFNVYRKEMQKSGIRGSALDNSTRTINKKTGRVTEGRTTELYNHIATKKGKAYADKVERKVQNVAITKFCTTTAVGVGTYFAAAYLAYKQ